MSAFTNRESAETDQAVESEASAECSQEVVGPETLVGEMPATREIPWNAEQDEGFSYAQETHHSHTEVASKLFAIPAVPSVSSVWGFFSDSAEAASKLVDSAASSDIATTISGVASSAVSKAAAAASATHKEFLDEKKNFMGDESETVCDAGILPWEPNSPHSTEIRERVLRLSADDATFLTPPPADVEFSFDFDTNAGPALLMLEADPQVSTRRFKLVPQKVDENSFWENYFYRVSLITSSYAVTAPSSADQEAQARHLDGATMINTGTDPEEALAAEDEQPPELSGPGPEFVSDDMLLTGSGASWEDEIQAELDFELLGDDLKGEELLAADVDGVDEEGLEAQIKAELNIE